MGIYDARLAVALCPAFSGCDEVCAWKSGVKAPENPHTCRLRPQIFMKFHMDVLENAQLQLLPYLATIYIIRQDAKMPTTEEEKSHLATAPPFIDSTHTFPDGGI